MVESIKEPPPKKVRKRIKIDAGFDSGMVSIRGFKKEKKIEEAQNEAEDFSNKPKEDFSKDDFLNAWNTYIQQLKNTGKSSFASTLEVSAPKLDGVKVTVEIENSVQENELNAEKSGLMEHLRKTLNNYAIQLDYNKVEVKEERRYYTNTERFNRLSEINPTLSELKKRFNLETDF